MNRYLIEVPHEGNKRSCDLAMQTFLKKGYHFFTNAGWGCPDGEHKGWIIVDVESKEQATMIVPPEYRAAAKIVRLEKFTPEEVEEKLTVYHA